MGWGQGSGKMVPVGAEHRLVVIITTVIISALHGSATGPSRGGDGGDKGWGAEGLGAGEGSTGRRLAEGLASCLAAASGQVGAQCCQERDPGLWVAPWPDKALITERK